MITQIYGITTPEDASAVAELGADRIGIVVCEDEEQTPDGNSLEHAQEIKRAIPSEVTVSALTFSTDTDEIEEMVRRLRPDVLHLSKSVELFPLSAIRELKRRLPDLKVMPTIPVAGPESVEQALELVEVAESILLDTPNTAIDSIGATGKLHDWNISREIVDRSPVPIILAGGLDADNVGDAIAKVRPWGVDSFTLTSDPYDLRCKDLDKVHRFIESARKAA